jgi:hypothetical protein
MLTLILPLHRFITYDHQTARKVEQLSGGRHAIIAHYALPDFKKFHIFYITKKGKVGA